MNANNANYNNNNKSGIVKKIESNFQLQYKGKMNNNKSNITNMEERIKALKDHCEQAEARHATLKEQDPNQYYNISNKKEYIKRITNQIKTGVATGNCLRENMALFAFTLQRIMKGNEQATEAKYIHYEYGDERRGAEYTGNHMAVMVKINNVWYIRSHANNVQEQRELNGYFEDRHLFKIKGNPYYLPITKTEQGFQVSFNGVESLKPFELNPYFNHNKIVLNARNEW